MTQPMPPIAASRATRWTWRGAKLMSTFCLLALASHITPIDAFTADRPGGSRILPAGRTADAPASPSADAALRRLAIGRQMLHGDYVWDEAGVPPGRVQILVDLSAQTLSVIRSGHEIGRAVILYGTDEQPTPTGRFPIIEKDADHVSNLYEAIMPYMLRLTGDGIAIHGSNVRYGWASRGCVGVPDEFAALLFAQARVGDVVTIVSGGAPGPTPAP